MLQSLFSKVGLTNRLPSLDAVRASGQWRHLPKWFASRRPNYLLRHGLPWLSFDAIEWIRAQLEPGLQVFEYGGGASTVFWSRAGATVTTIEHDADWILAIRQWLPEQALVTLRHYPPDDAVPVIAPNAIDADTYGTDWAAFAGRTFKAYATAIKDFTDNSLDVVVVDGQARPSCLKHSWKKVRFGGWLILDNANWSQYQPAIEMYLEGWDRLRFIGLAPIDGALSETDIFIRRK
jgi:hypothetical protein